MAVTSYYKSGLTIESRSQDASYDGATWTELGTEYKGFVQPLSGSESFKFGKSGEDVTHRFYTYLTTPCEYGYRLTWNGSKYTMVYTDQPEGISSRSSHKEVMIRLLKDGEN